MTDIHPYSLITQRFDALFKDLAETWPEEDLREPRRIADHAEGDIAIDELIATGLQNGREFTKEQAETIELLAHDLAMEDTTWIEKLRDHGKASRD